MRRHWALLLVVPLAVFLGAFFVLPFLAMAWLGFTPSPLVGDGPFSAVANFRLLITDLYYLGVLGKTVMLGVVVVAFTLVLGYPCAYYIAQSPPRARGLYLFVVVSPLLVSIVIRSFGWMVLLGNEGLVNHVLRRLGLIDAPIALMGTWPGVVIGLTHVLLPYMVLPVASVLEGIDPGLFEAARVLGATPWQAFRRVIFPLTVDGIATGSILVFMLTIGSFATVLLLGGPDTMILPLLIYQQIQVTFDHALASSAGTMLLLMGMAVLYLQARLMSRRALAS